MSKGFNRVRRSEKPKKSESRSSHRWNRWFRRHSKLGSQQNPQARTFCRRLQSFLGSSVGGFPKCSLNYLVYEHAWSEVFFLAPDVLDRRTWMKSFALNAFFKNWQRLKLSMLKNIRFGSYPLLSHSPVLKIVRGGPCTFHQPYALLFPSPKAEVCRMQQTSREYRLSKNISDA